MIAEGTLFSDETREYVSPCEIEPGDTVRIRLRAPKEGIDRVEYVDAAGDAAQDMFYSYSDTYFDYYEIHIKASESPLRYYFQIQSDSDIYFYTRVGENTTLNKEHCFCLIPGFKTPEWSKGAIMYQIFVDRFCRDNPSNDVLDDEYIYIGLPTRRIEDWNEYPQAFDVGYFYGGDLSGVLKKLGYLKELGVEAIYLNPIFVSPSNHKYDTQDYEHIDPHYTIIKNDGGDVLPEDAEDNENATKYMLRTTAKENLDASDEFFAKFVSLIHAAGMKVIIDGVFNHCGSFNKWMDREGIYKKAGIYPPGAFKSKDSPYRDYFTFYKNEDNNWPDNDSYDGWWGNDTLPKLNYEDSPELVDEILSIAKKWISPPYNVDGWRLDVAADLGHSEDFNHHFWKQFRKAVKSINPDVLIIAEHYGDPSKWLCGNEWDTVMNYDGFMEPVSFFLTGMEKHSDRSDMSLKGDGKRFFDSMLKAKARMPMPSYMSAMNELSNHDHSRFLTRTNGMEGRLTTRGSLAAAENIDYAIMRQAIVLHMTWQGAATIYYGDEAGVCGWTDPDSRRTYPWGCENIGLVDFHIYVDRLHNMSKALRLGSLIPVMADKDIVVYGRVYENDIMLIAIMTGDGERQIDIPIWKLGASDTCTVTRYILTDAKGYSVGKKQENKIANGYIALSLKAKAAAVYKINSHR